jgi:hypothetical protein
MASAVEWYSGSMPRFFFHLYEYEPVLDEEGEELTGLEAAQAAALRSARSLAAEQVLKGKLNLNHSIDIVDDSGAVVCTVTFRDAFEIEG